MENEKTVREILDTYGKYTSLTRGVSMWPLLYNQRDNIIVVKNTERLKKYDIALFERANGQLVMHRVTEVHDGYYFIIGDNCISGENVSDDMVLGVLTGFYRRGKIYVDCENGRAQKIYARIWVALAPLRPLLLKAEGLARRIKRLFKGNNNG